MSNRTIPQGFDRLNPPVTPTEAPPKVTTQVYHRLSSEAYQSIERLAVPPAVTNQTTDIAAGFALGAQSVLRILREGFVVGA